MQFPMSQEKDEFAMSGPPLADRVHLLHGESAFAVLARAQELERAGKHVIHLEIGEPDFPTPPHIVEAADRALREGYTHYGPTPGLRPFR